MPDAQMTFLVVSRSLALLHTVEPALLAFRAQIKVEISAQRALQIIRGPDPLALVLVDGDLPALELDQLLASVQTQADRRRFSIVLILCTVTNEALQRLNTGEVDDVILKSAPSSYWRLRLESVMRTFCGASEPGRMRGAAELPLQTDPFAGIHDYDAMLSLLFRETDRVQRMKTSLCLILFEVNGCEQSSFDVSSRDELRVQIVDRVQCLLRSYDLLGTLGKDRFLLGLPGCDPRNAVMLAERIGREAFSGPFRLRGRTITQSACFGIAASLGRSPLVVLREAEQALERAKAAGPSSIHSADSCRQPQEQPWFPAVAMGDDVPAW